MALSRKHHLSLKFAVLIYIWFFSLTLLPPKSAGIEESSSSSSSTADDEQQMRKTILGSRPPGCVNKCMSCRPCEATLVIPPHKMMFSSTRRMINSTRGSFVKSSRRQEDDTYYLLSWKCRCGNKFYQP